LKTAGNLADSLSRPGKYDEAEKMQREVLAVKQRVLGAEHPSKLSTTNNLDASLMRFCDFVSVVTECAKESTMRRRRCSARCLMLVPSILTR